ncbi:hypothetical protein [Rhizorhapis sp.]|uniref:hypothetical protein n=1 Tax=Rhizorhapis sp. TaxID=1968842 RepID=UPI002B47EEE5|nr:hypothetical protein [Rhizorhapis sp.]HKR17719.1 hypothetical protein [Rhizorhapis sp.]
MIYRVKSDGDGFRVEVEDEEGVILASVPAATIMEAKRLQRVARFDGIDAVKAQAPEKPAKKKGK